jgi:hypothetical protein
MAENGFMCNGTRTGGDPIWLVAEEIIRAGAAVVATYWAVGFPWDSGDRDEHGAWGRADPAEDMPPLTVL